MTIKLIQITVVLFLSILQLQAQPPRGEDHSTEQIERVKSLKIAYITDALKLTTTESQSFWPIYNKYEEKQRKVRHAMHELRPSPSMSDAAANKLIDTHLAKEQELVDLRKQMVQELRTAIPPIKIIQLDEAERSFKRQLIKRLKPGERGIRERRD